MKKVLLLALTLITFNCVAVAPVDSTGLAKVQKQQGIEIYIQSEPLRPYDVTGRVDNMDNADYVNQINDAVNETSTASQRCKTLSENLKILIDNAIAESKRKKHPFVFDAILTDDGTKGTCIKFK